MMKTDKSMSLTGAERVLTPESAIRHCEVCGEPLQRIFHFREGGFDDVVPVLCRCGREKRDQDEAIQAERERAARIERMRADGVPAGILRKATFSASAGYNAREMAIAENYVNLFYEMEQNGSGLLLWGGVGTGKTFIAACIANALIDQGVSVLMTNVPRIMNGMSGLFSEDRNRYLDQLNRYRLLIIDDLGSERNTEYSTEQLYTVIDNRYRSGKPMILTTNLTLDEMKNIRDRAHERIYGRILERCMPLRVNNENIRMKNADLLFGRYSPMLIQDSASIDTRRLS